MKTKFGFKETAAYGFGAVGKDMVYALSASYVMYFYQDVLGLSATYVGLILLIARVFDAINDPFMGVVVAKTRSRFGRFRPWILAGTVLNALVLYALFKAPKTMSLTVYFPLVYILWGMTYTMMDIPYWSMIPAVTDNIKDRENLSVVGRTCAGVGNALITVGTVLAVASLGGGNEKLGFSRFALIVAIIFVISELVLFFCINEKPLNNQEKMETSSVSEMFKALFNNDQAMIVVITIVLINSALYITSNLLIYFFKYDLSGTSWQGNYTLFSSVGGLGQILGMMLVYPFLRKKLSNTQIFTLCLLMSISGYILLLLACFSGLAHNMIILCACGLLVFLANGMLTVLTTVFLANTVDYGQLKSGHREESVIFSMQTFVVKLASGLAVFLCGIGLDLIGLQGNSETTGEIIAQSTSTITGLRLLMTILPVIGLFVALIVFKKKFILDDQKSQEIADQLRSENEA